MTKLLDRAISKARALTEAEQDEAAEILLWAMGDQYFGLPLDGGPMSMNVGLEHGRRGEFGTTDDRASFRKQ